MRGPSFPAGLDGHHLEPLLRQVGQSADALGLPVYVIGGFVRDLFLDRQTTDLDFVSVGSRSGLRIGEEVARRLGGTRVHTYETFGTAAIRVPFEDQQVVLEFVGARRESYDRTSRKPAVEDGSLEDDQRRRDFTVNALSIALHEGELGELQDPFGGLQDLNDRVLRTPLEPERTFDDDPLRMIRGARFAAQLGFTVHEDALAAMRGRADRVDILSPERIAEEFHKLLCSPRPSVGFRILEEVGILSRVLPELTDLKGVEAAGGHRHKDNFYHTLQVVDNLVEMTQDRPCEDTLWLRWAALLHDIGKTATKRFVPGTGWTFHGHEERGARLVKALFKRLRLPSDERLDAVCALIRLHHRPVALVDDEVTDSAVRRLLFDAGDLIEDLMTLVRADITSKNPARVRRYLRAFDRVDGKLVEVEEKDRLRNFQPPVDGREIMETLGIRAGLAVGIIKDAIREAILDGAIPNEHDPAFAYMMRLRDDALRRGALFERAMAELKGPQRRALGAVKQEAVEGALPAGDDEALAHLLGVAALALEQS